MRYWGLEHIEIADSEQDTGTQPDTTLIFLDEMMSQYDVDTRTLYYFDQFPKIVYKTIVEPAITYLDTCGVSFTKVSVTHEQLGNHLCARIQLDGNNIMIPFSPRELEDHSFPDYLCRKLAGDLLRLHERNEAKFAYALMSDSQRQYLHRIMDSNGFYDSMDDLYFSPHFREFRDRRLIVKEHGMWLPSRMMHRIWEWNQPDA